MRCLYQKDERALPGNLQNRKYSFFLSYSPQNVVSLTTSPFLSSLSLSLSLSICVFRSVNLEMAVRRVGGWREIAASLRGREPRSRGTSTFGRHYQAEQ
jgi:hypothetical protein